jgi:hypothetical protein
MIFDYYMSTSFFNLILESNILHEIINLFDKTSVHNLWIIFIIPEEPILKWLLLLMLKLPGCYCKCVMQLHWYFIIFCTNYNKLHQLIF